MEPEFNGMIVLDVEPNPADLESYAVHVFITGTTQLPYTKFFSARFGDEPIEELAVDLLGTGISGYLQNEPADGTRLFIEVPGHEPIDTGFAYSRPNV